MESGEGMSAVAEQIQENSDVSLVVSDNENNALSSVNPGITGSCNVSESVNTPSNGHTSSDERKLVVDGMHDENNASSSVNPAYTGSCNVSDSLNTPSNDNTSNNERKLFVGGMHWQTGEKDLRDHFGQFGEIEHIKLKSDRPTGCSRGFAFIVFRSSESIHKVEAVSDHVINGKKVDPKRAKTRQSKIYVGSLTPDITDEDIKSHFAQFGTIVEAQMPYDTALNQRKGFCFIIFETEEVVKNVLKMPKQMIKGKEITVKRAVPKPSIYSPISNQMKVIHGVRGGYGGVIGGRGGFGSPGFNRGIGGVRAGRGDFFAASLSRGYGGRGKFGAPGSNSGYSGVRGGRGGFGVPDFNSIHGGMRGGRGGFIHDNWQSYGSSHSNVQNNNPRGASFGGHRYQPY